MSEERKCSTCGATLGSDAPEGLCPRCLLALNIGKPTEMPGESGGERKLDPPPPVEEIAKLFPQLELLGLIGRGGMGIVYRARQPRLNRIVALKILAPDKRADKRFAERFQREAQALARLSHPNIVTVYDFGESGGHYYLIMEYVDGMNLREMLHARRLAPEEAFAIVPKICDALQYAHEQGVIHRDIKPENILIDKQGRLKIADFGIAKMMAPIESQAEQGGAGTLTNATNVIGTPNYMAPEQMEKPQTVDHRADIYSLGVVFYEMLTGELPIGKFQPPSQKVQVDVRLDDVVLRTLEKEPARRYQHASEVKVGMERITQSAALPQETVRIAAEKTAVGHWSKYVLAGVGTCLAILAVGALLWNWIGHSNSAPAQHAAKAEKAADPVELAKEGWQLWQAQRGAEAAQKFSEALKIEPDNANTWNGLGWAHFASGRATDAEKAFRQAVTLEPLHPAALNGLGQTCLAQKRYAEAESYLLKAAPRASAAAFGLARLYLLRGDYEQAEKWARNAIASGERMPVLDQMLQAAKDKKLSDDLRRMLE